MSRCMARSNARPAVRPNGKSRNTARGAPEDWVIERALDKLTDGIPRASTSLAISPTDWWQTGQTGTMSATSTASATSRSASAGASTSRTLRAE